MILGCLEMVLPAKCERARLRSGSSTSIVEPSSKFAKAFSVDGQSRRSAKRKRGPCTPDQSFHGSCNALQNATLGMITALDECVLPQEESP